MIINKNISFITILLLTIINVNCNNLNIEIINTEKRDIFTTDKEILKIKKIIIQNSDHTKIDKILQENIYNTLNFTEGNYINLQNTTISTSLNRIKKLFKIIKNVTIEGELENNELILIFKIIYYEKITNIITLNKNINKKKFEDIKKNFISKNLTPNTLNELENNLKKICRKTTNFHILTENAKIHTLTITPENKKKSYYVKNVEITGNNHISESKIINKLTIKGAKYFSIGKNTITTIKNSKLNNFSLTNVLNNKSKLLIWKNIHFDDETFKKDKKKIIDTYLSKGFLDIEIQKIDLELDKSNNTINIKYNLNEGKQYFVGNVEFIGNRKISSETLNEIIGMKKYTPFNYIKIKNSISDSFTENITSNIKKLYNLIGYTKNDIQLKIKSINSDNTIDIAFLIDEGDKNKINKITVTGNKYVNSTEFYKSSFLFPGDTYNMENYIATQQNILRNEFLEPKKSFVTIDNDNNVQMIIKEKIGFEPILNISTQKVDENSCCCDWCKIGPAINLGCKMTNLNLRKLLHLRNNKYSLFGAGDMAKIQFVYSPIDSKINVELSTRIREITKHFGSEIGIIYSRFNETDEINKDKNKKSNKKKKKKCGGPQIHEFNIMNTYIYSNFKNTLINISRPILINTKINKNKYNRYKYTINVNISNEIKYTTLNNTIWETNGFETDLNITLTNPILFAIKSNNNKKYVINKHIKILSHLLYFKEIYKNISFHLGINLGYNKSFNKHKNSFKIEKDDNVSLGDQYNKELTLLYLNGINENSTLLNIINKNQFNLAFKLNIELRYLFLYTNIANAYLFTFFNGGNLFFSNDKNELRSLKQYGNIQRYNPLRIYSFGIGIRFEPELLKFIIPNLQFSIYYDIKNSDISFNLIKR